MPDWIKKGASKHPGAFKKKAEKAGETGDSGKLGKETRFAENAMDAGKKRSRLPYKTRKD